MTEDHEPPVQAPPGAPKPFRIRLNGPGGVPAGYWYLRPHSIGWLLTYRHLRRKRFVREDGVDWAGGSLALAKTIEAHVDVLWLEAQQTELALRTHPRDWDRPGFRKGTAKRRLTQLSNHLASFQRDWDARVGIFAAELAQHGWPPAQLTMPWRRPAIPGQVLA